MNLYWISFFIGLLFANYGMLGLFSNPDSWKKLYSYTILSILGLIIAFGSVFLGNLK